MMIMDGLINLSKEKPDDLATRSDQQVYSMKKGSKPPERLQNYPSYKKTGLK